MSILEQCINIKHQADANGVRLKAFELDMDAVARLYFEDYQRLLTDEMYARMPSFTEFIADIESGKAKILGLTINIKGTLQ